MPRKRGSGRGSAVGGRGFLKARAASGISRVSQHSYLNEAMDSQFGIHQPGTYGGVRAVYYDGILTIFGLQDHHWRKLESSSSRPDLQMQSQPDDHNLTSRNSDAAMVHKSNSNGNTQVPDEYGSQSEELRESMLYDPIHGSRKSQRQLSMVKPSYNQSDDEANSTGEERGPSNGDGQEIKDQNAKIAPTIETLPVLSTENVRAIHLTAPRAAAAPVAKQAPPQPMQHELLTDEDLPAAYITRDSTPTSTFFSDPAEELLQTRFPRLPSPSTFVNAMAKYPPSQRSTANLYLLAANAQSALVAWQDEYLALDAHTAPLAHPPKKPATGGRLPIDPELWEDLKEADLYNYTFDHKKGPGNQNPFLQRAGPNHGGRELRQRQRPLAGTKRPQEGDSSEDLDPAAKRIRRAVSRFGDGNGTPTGATTSKGRLTAGATPDTEDNAVIRKRGRPPQGGLRQRLAASMRNSMQPASGGEMDQGGDESRSVAGAIDGQSPRPEGPRRRGRPPGSKNLAKRSDAGIKKGPRGPKSAAATAGGPTGASAVTARKMSYKRKQRIKSEKRSQSMTQWWAERKAKAAAAKRGDGAAKKVDGEGDVGSVALGDVDDAEEEGDEDEDAVADFEYENFERLRAEDREEETGDFDEDGDEDADAEGEYFEEMQDVDAAAAEEEHAGDMAMREDARDEVIGTEQIGVLADEVRTRTELEGKEDGDEQAGNGSLPALQAAVEAQFLEGQR